MTKLIDNTDVVIPVPAPDSVSTTVQQPDAEKQGLLADLIRERKDRQDLQKKLDEFITADKKLKEDKLIEQGELKKLLDAKENEIEDLKAFEIEAKAYRDLISAEREEVKKILGDKWDEDFGKLSIPSLRKLVKQFELPSKVIDTDKGIGKTVKDDLVLNDAQKKEAKTMFPFSVNCEELYSEVLQSRVKK